MEKKSILYYTVYKSPIGPLKIVSSDKGVVAIVHSDYEKGGPIRKANSHTAGKTIVAESEYSENHPILIQAKEELGQYFAGNRERFGIPVEIEGTPFQVKVWKAMYNIPFGIVKSYGDIAAEVGSSKASRAVGMACKKNPLLIVVPCHRVIGTNNRLTGFNIGIDRKKFLLEHENIKSYK